MQISVVNLSDVADEEVQRVLRAINLQISQDVKPYWDFEAQLRLSGRVEGPLDRQRLAGLQGDAVIYLAGGVDQEAGVLGYHDENNAGIPFGVVFKELSEQLGEPWSVTLSHEALELLGDANVNKLVAGPDPRDPSRAVYHWYELCDAVQAESYEIEGVALSNFVTPLYFTPGEQVSARNDFLGRVYNGRTLASFGINPGGYVGFYDPDLGDHDTFPRPGEPGGELAAERLRIKARAELTRRALRYRALPERAVERSDLPEPETSR
jgi:hypothetical protein